MSHKDYAGNEIKLGDLLAFAYGYKGCSLGIGRVIRLTPKRVVVMEAIRHDEYGPLKRVGRSWMRDVVKVGEWKIRETIVRHLDRSIVITMSSFPMEAFALLDNLNITGKKNK